MEKDARDSHNFMCVYVCQSLSCVPTLEPPGKSDFIARVNETDKQTKCSLQAQKSVERN